MEMTNVGNLLELRRIYSRGITGKGITTAVLDTGIYAHPDFFIPQNKILYFQDFVRNRRGPFDDNGHGTHVSGIIASGGRFGDGSGIGVAPESSIVMLKVLERDGSGKIKNMIKGTSFAIAQDEVRPILQGILFEVKDKQLNLVALDGYRLAIRNELLDIDNDIEVVIPGKTLNEVSKILEDNSDLVEITFTSNHILFNLKTTKVISRLLEGKFVNYNSLLPQEHKLIVNVKKQELQNGIERASLMAKDGNSNLIKLDVQEDILIITSNSQLGKVREEVNINLRGEGIQIAFNSRYLLDVLKSMEEEEIVIELTSSVSPCVIKGKNSNNAKYLVLPVRLVR